ncbi:Bug family tripartite tricarboxylate transporter substrate binding protein [Cupriavidus basilensis]
MLTLFRTIFILALCLVGAAGNAQDKYPSKPVMLVLGYSAGGIGDGIARQIAQFAHEKRGATIVVDYKPGAASTIATGIVKRAPADGYTVSLMSPSAMFVAPHFLKLPYDPMKDFSYLGLVMTQPYPMFVLANSPLKTWADVLAYARKNPGKFKWGTAGANTLGQILVQSAFGREKVDTTTVPFKGGAEAITGLLGGHIDAVVSSDFGPLLASGKVRLIVETGETRAQPQIPTLKDLGYPLAISLKYGMFGPAGLSPEVVNWWSSLLKEFAESAEYKEFAKLQFGMPTYATPSATTHYVTDNYTTVGTAVKQLGLDRIN